MRITSVLIFLVSGCLTLAAGPEAWRDRSIYQLLTDRYARTDGSTTASCASNFQGFCGGTWKGIQNHLDYIQNMGFDAIWISPVTQQVADPTRAYTGYMQTNLFGTNANFGTPQDLQSLSRALKSRGMLLMVDIVVNHFGAPGPASSVNYGWMNPFSQQSLFHPVCWITDNDYATHDQNMLNCWLGNEQYPVPDVDTTQATVRSTYASWIKSLVANYSIDGLRIDTVKNVEQDFWGPFQDAAGIYAMGEVADGNVDFVCPFQSSASASALDGVLNYPMYYAITDFLQSTSSTTERFINTAAAINSSCTDPGLLGSFSENHDQPRLASYTSDLTLAQNALTYTLLADGIPVVYAGQEQHYNGDVNNDREATWLSKYSTSAPLVRTATDLNKVRRAAINAASPGAYSTSRADFFYHDDHSVGIAKGPSGSRIVYAVSNVGSNSGQVSLDLGTGHGFPQGTQLMEVLSCNIVTTGNEGDLVVKLAGGVPQVLFPVSGLAGSGLCGR